MLEVIRIGALELRFLQSKESSDGSLDLFEMTIPQGARAIPISHENWDETVYGSAASAPGASTSGNRVGARRRHFRETRRRSQLSQRAGAAATCPEHLSPACSARPIPGNGGVDRAGPPDPDR